MKQELEAKDAQIVAEKQKQEKIIERSITIIKVQTETLESDIVQKDKQIETLEKKVETLERDAYVLSYDHEMQEPIFVHKDEIITELKSAKSYFSDEVRELNEENSTLKSQNKTLKAKISTLPSEDMAKELKTLKNDSEALKKELNEFRALFKNLNNTIKNKLGDYRQGYYCGELPTIEDLVEDAIKQELKYFSENKNVLNDKQLEQFNQKKELEYQKNINDFYMMR